MCTLFLILGKIIQKNSKKFTRWLNLTIFWNNYVNISLKNSLVVWGRDIFFVILITDFMFVFYQFFFFFLLFDSWLARFSWNAKNIKKIAYIQSLKAYSNSSEQVKRIFVVFFLLFFSVYVYFLNIGFLSTSELIKHVFFKQSN